MAKLSEDAKQLIKEAVDTESLLRVLGFKVSRATASEVRAPCIIHGGDNPTAFSVHLETKKWKCFTQRCELSDAGRSDNDFIALVRKVTGRNFMDAVRFLADFSGLSLDESTLFVQDTEEHRRRRDVSQYIKSVSRVNKRAVALPELSEEDIGRYVQSRDDYFLARGFSQNTLNIFEIGSMVDRHGVPRATVPIRDAEGCLVGLSARRTDSDAEPRYLLEFDFQKGRILYNLHRASREASTTEGTVIVVEGFKALWAVYEAGYQNVVACMGANITQEQLLALCIAGFTRCLLMFDGDRAGIAGAESARVKLEAAFNTMVLTLPEGKSPDDFSREDLNDLLSLYVQSL